MHTVSQFLIFAIVVLVGMVSSLEFVPREVEIENYAYAKQCRAAHDCWRTEPVGPDALPLALSGRYKRLDIGGFELRRGRCRCRDGFCQYFQFATQNFFPCDEL